MNRPLLVEVGLQARIQNSEGGGGFVQEFRLENRSYPDVLDLSLRMQVIIANANNIADSRVSEHPPPPVSAPGLHSKRA